MPAILIAWYSGMEGGRALADVLLGRGVDVSGQLPYAVPTSEEHLPYFDREGHGDHVRPVPRSAASRPERDRGSVPFGFGLSYTTFVIGDVTTQQAADGTLAVHASLSNTGGRDGHHVVQVYGRRTDGPRAGETLLTGFCSVQIPAGATVEVTVPVTLEALGAWNPTTKRLDPPAPSAVVLEVGAHAHDPNARTVAPA